MKVNYKSDFELTIQLTAGGVDVAAPSWDWQLRFYTFDRQAVYTVTYIDGKAERCAVNTDGTITAYFDKHGLMPGALRCEFVNLVPDSHYTHDTQVQVDPVELGVELWRGASDGGMDAVTLELAGQVLAEVQALATDLQQKAESGYFDGEPGPQGPQGPPGPAGPGLLVVAVTGSDQEALTADHTAGEILAAHDAGRPVVAVYGVEVYQLASVGSSLASFSLASADLEVLAQIDVDADGGASRIFDEVQGALTAGEGINIDGNVISATGGGGTGIESIEQTVTSDESGGINVVTITMSDSRTADFEVMNGKKGDKGDPGPKGDSGVDLGEVVLVNDLTTGGRESALSAEQGKVLAGNETVTRTMSAAIIQKNGGQLSIFNIDLRAGVKYKITLSTDVANTKYYIRAARVDNTLDYLKTNTTANLTTPVTVEVTPDYDYINLRVNLDNVAADGTLTISVEGVLHKDGPSKYVPIGMGKNIYNPSEKRNGLRVDESGITSLHAASYTITGYIPIANGQTLVCNSVLNTYNTCALFARIGDWAPITGTFIAPDKALGYKAITNNLGYDAFAVFTISQIADDIQVEVGNTPSDYEPYNPISGYLEGDDESEKHKSNIIFGLAAVVKGINHRGFNTIAPENTMPAFRMSVQKGFAYIETDVHFTSDGVAVLLHDGTINRTARNADGTTIESTTNIADITYAQALTYDFGIWKSSAYAGTKIPTLAQLLNFCRATGVHPYIELKCTNDKVDDVVAIVETNGMKDHVTYIGTQAKLELVHTADANARLGLVIGTVDASSITNLLTLKTTTNEVFIDAGDESANAVTLCKNAKVPMERYTINTSAGITALDPYITGVTSDNLVASTVLYESVEL